MQSPTPAERRLLQLAASVLQSILNHQLGAYGGDLAISVMGILYAMFMMVAMPIFGINQGAQPIIGYNYGAERFDRVKKALELAIFAATGIADAVDVVPASASANPGGLDSAPLLRP